MVPQLGDYYAAKAGVLFVAVMGLSIGFLQQHHPFPRFGAANRITTLRAVLVSLVAGLVGEARLPRIATAAVVASVAVTAFDGVDGWLARRNGIASPFGARFDMEIDALLILALSALAWRHDKAGAWVIVSGLMRYAFIAAGSIASWMRAALPPSRRRQTICVVQIAALTLVMVPAVQPPASAAIAAAALMALTTSFLIDTDVALAAARSMTRRGIALAAAVMLLDISLAFQNVWPTPMVRWSGEFSVECGVLLVLLIAGQLWLGPLSRTATRWLTAGWIVLVLGHYADVTTPALYGRDINLYWDVRYMPDVAAMIARRPPLAHHLRRRGGGRGPRASLRGVSMGHQARRSGGVRCAGARANLHGGRDDRRVLHGAAARQTLRHGAHVRDAGHADVRAAGAAGGRRAQRVEDAAAEPADDRGFALVRDVDVFLVFIESYGCDRLRAARHGAAALGRPRRSRLRRSAPPAARSSRRSSSRRPSADRRGSRTSASCPASRSAIRRPTRADDAKRDTLVTAFKRRRLPHGRADAGTAPGVAGGRVSTDSTTIYGATRLDYRGPEFGWFAIPDQFAMAKFDALEVSQPSRTPRSSCSSPPSARTLRSFRRRRISRTGGGSSTRTRTTGRSIVRAYAEQPDWLHLGPGYAQAIAYDYATLGGLPAAARRSRLRDDPARRPRAAGGRQRRGRVVGRAGACDRQPHADVLDRLRARGFRDGLTPARPSLGRMHTLLPTLLDAFSTGGNGGDGENGITRRNGEAEKTR